jgi:hypothetical protein
MREEVDAGLHHGSLLKVLLQQEKDVGYKGFNLLDKVECCLGCEVLLMCSARASRVSNLHL